MFKKEKSFRYLRNKYYRTDKGKIDIRKLSKKELFEIREKVIKERRKENLRAWIFTFVVLISIVLFGVYLINSTENDTSQEKNSYRSEKSRLENYRSYLNLGDKMILNQNWKYAIIQYEKATKVFPKRYTANYKLVLAYSYNCKNNNLDCEKTEKLVKELLENFPQAKGQLGTIMNNLKTQ